MSEVIDGVDGEVDEEEYVSCPDCGGSGKRQIPILNDWDEVEDWTERTCSFCGGSGKFFADQAAELKAEGVWYDPPSNYGP